MTRVMSLPIPEPSVAPSFSWKKRPKGLGLRRNLKVSVAHAPKPAEQPVNKSLCVLPKPQRALSAPREEITAYRTAKANELYVYKEGSYKVWQGGVHKKTFLIEFNPFLDAFPCPEQAMMLCFIDLASRQFHDLGSFYMYVGFEINNIGFDEAITVPYRPIDSLNPLDFENEVRQLKSRLRGVNTVRYSEYEVSICYIKQMIGSGKPKLPTNDPLGIQKKPRIIDKENIVQNNVANYCLGTAIIQGMAWVTHTEDPEHRGKEMEFLRTTRVNDNSRECQDILTAGKNLLQRSGVMKSGDYTVSDAAKVQEFLSGKYQIVIFADSHYKTPVFKGPSLMEKKIIGLVCKNGHYQLIKRLYKFVKAGFYCVHCDVKSPSLGDHYSCPLRCRLCSVAGCLPEEGVEIECPDCLQTFYSQQCLQNHKTRGVSGVKSRCESTVICPQCKKILSKNNKLHECNSYYCHNCKVVRPRGHQCSLAPKEGGLKLAAKEKRIFFTVKVEEIEKDDNSILYRPVIIMAIKVCPNCRHNLPVHLTTASESSCEVCCDSGRRCFLFERLEEEDASKDIMKEFLDWLIVQAHNKFVAVTHMMNQGVSDYILDYLTRDGVPKPKKVIMKGGKLECLEIEGCLIKIMDSRNLIPGTMDEYAKELGLPDIGKGFFPKCLISAENFDYIGKMPPLDVFLPDEATLEERVVIAQYYSQMVAQKKVFFLKEELQKYTYLELIQMAACILTTESVGFEMIAVKLIDEASNYRKAAIRGFRRKFLKDLCLPLDTGYGSKFRSTFSVMAMKYLNWRQKAEGLRIDTALNVGEYRVPNTPFHLDGFIQPCEKYPRGLGIDVKGCYWHAHGCTYVPQMVARRELSIPTIRANDKKREEEVKKHSDFEVVWECEIAELRRTNLEMDKHMNAEVEVEKVDSRAAIYPMYSEVFHFKKRPQKDKRRVYVKSVKDQKALALKYGRFPSGPFRRLHGAYIKCPITESGQLECQVKGIVYCTVLPPKYTWFPLLPYDIDGKVVHTLCRCCAESDNPRLCDHSDNDRAITGTWTTFELELALENGYKIIKVIGAQHWDDWSEFEVKEGQVSHGLFSEYADAVFGYKLMSAGYPSDVKTEEEKKTYVGMINDKYAIQLNGPLVSNRPSTYKIADDLLDVDEAFAERNDVPSTQMIGSLAELWKTLEDPTLLIKEVNTVNNDKAYIAVGKREEQASPLFETVSVVKALTASYWRCRVFREISKLPNLFNDLLYIDKDFIVYDGLRDKDPLPDFNPSMFHQQQDFEQFTAHRAGEFMLHYHEMDLLHHKLVRDGLEKTGDSALNHARRMLMVVNDLMVGLDHSTDLIYMAVERDAHYLLKTKEKIFRLDGLMPRKRRIHYKHPSTTHPIGTPLTRVSLNLPSTPSTS